MSSVDNRVVSITFDNAAFERKLSETINSLDKLRESLNFNSAKTNMQDVAKAIEGFKFGDVTNAIENVSKSFLALSTIALTAISNITSKAVDAGITIAKSFTLDPIIDGFREYETQMNAVQTILANTAHKGTTIADVGKALDELNNYADLTIYNFTEMTRNIGTFTAAGVGLNESVAAIKGFSNVSATAGANATDTARAMYQLSQAMSSGQVRLQDWMSIERAGISTEVFRNALLETARVHGVAVDDMIKKTGSFRLSLSEGWLSADIMTETLQKFTGDLTDAQLASMGYNEQQIAGIQEMARVALDSATKVKTFTQLLGTIKETIGSGWSQTFRIVIGDFEQARELFTKINDVISGFISANAEARNELLGGWAWMGGRVKLIETLGEAFRILGRLIKPIGDAFREIFPRKTSMDLIVLTDRFAAFVDSISFGGSLINKIKRTFLGFFSIFSIGLEIIKGFIGLIADLFGALSSNSGGVLATTANIGDFIVQLRYMLVEGGGISAFFDKLSEAFKKPVEFITRLKDALVGLFLGDFSSLDGAGTVVDRLSERFSLFGKAIEVVQAAWDWLGGMLQRIKDVFEPVIDYIQSFFSELGNKIADALSPADFDSVVDIINVGLLGGILATTTQFMRNGINIDFGDGFLSGITESLNELTGVLSAMQTNLKADALMKIAIALGVLTASIVVLSMIDSAKLSAALGAVAVGFGQLITAMVAINKLTVGTAAPKLMAMAVAMAFLGVAILTLSFAVRSFSKLEWDEMVRGLVGVTGGLMIMSAAIKIISGSSGAMARASFAMIGMSIALLIMSKAVKEFAEMDWGEMARGLAGVTIALAALVIAARLLPSGMVAQGLGIIAIAIGLRILADVVQEFASLDWSVMGRGFAGVAGGLLIIAAAMHLMPSNILLTAAGLLVVSFALGRMVDAVAAMGNLSLEQMLKGLGGLAAMLLILALGVNLMSGALSGAAALVVVSASLFVLAEVLAKLSELSIAEIITSLITVAAVLALLGVAASLLSPVIPAMLGMGLALSALGVAFVLFGTGAALLAEAFKIMAQSGKAGAEAFIGAVGILLAGIPDIIGAVIAAIVQFVTEFAQSIKPLLDAIGVVVVALLEQFIKILPKIFEVFGAFLSGILSLIREKVPEIVETIIAIVASLLVGIQELVPLLIETGYSIILSFLKGIRDNIGEIVTVVADIITNFLDALALKVPQIIDSLVNLVIAIVEGVILKLGELATRFAPQGMSILQGLLDGALEVWSTVWGFFSGIGSEILAAVGEFLGLLYYKGKDLLQGLWNGAQEVWNRVKGWISSIPTLILGTVGSLLSTLNSRGRDLLQGLWDGIKTRWDGVSGWLRDMPTRIKNALGNIANSLYDVGKDIFEGLLDGMKSGWDRATGWMSGLNPANWKGPPKRDAVMLVENGMLIMKGLLVGMKSGWNEVTDYLQELDPVGEIDVSGIASAMQEALDHISGMTDMQPTITPVLDLSQITDESKKLNNLLAFDPLTLTPQVSTGEAKLISHTTEEAPQTPNTPDQFDGSTEIKFEQNIYSPTALSTNDIYRSTRSQIVLAKEELNIP